MCVWAGIYFFAETNGAVAYPAYKISQDSARTDAAFKYGSEAMREFIDDMLITPMDAAFFGINGKVRLSFTVDTSGHVADITVIKEDMLMSKGIEFDKPGYNNNHVLDKINGMFGKQAVRVIELMDGLWSPATKNNSPVNSLVELTFSFRTEQYDANNRSYRNGNQILFGEYTKKLPDYGLNFYNIGVAKMSEGKIDIAEKFFSESVNFNAVNVDAYYNLGAARFKLGDTEGACRAWQKGAKLGDPEIADLLKKYCEIGN
ncbi:MAG: hypothetical protein H6585_09040 [Flavobacteriales bacterium]|nr:hypothetical protein [Flavobacteriales bacterium]MCB9448474.1 hypothetical protein [Flavobacteriales bacterium]